MANTKREESIYTKLGHVALVVPDMDAAFKFFTALGIPIWPTDSQRHRQCKGRFGDLGLEVFQPIGEEESIHKEFYDRTGGGVHHLSFDGIENLEEAVNLLQKNGAKVVSSALDPDGTARAHYLEVDALPGVLIEIKKSRII